MQNHEFSNHANQTLKGTLLSAKIDLNPALVKWLLENGSHIPFFPFSNIFRTSQPNLQLKLQRQMKWGRDWNINHLCSGWFGEAAKYSTLGVERISLQWCSWQRWLCQHCYSWWAWRVLPYFPSATTHTLHLNCSNSLLVVPTGDAIFAVWSTLTWHKHCTAIGL